MTRAQKRRGLQAIRRIFALRHLQKLLDLFAAYALLTLLKRGLLVFVKTFGTQRAIAIFFSHVQYLLLRRGSATR